MFLQHLINVKMACLSAERSHRSPGDQRVLVGLVRAMGLQTQAFHSVCASPRRSVRGEINQRGGCPSPYHLTICSDVLLKLMTGVWALSDLVNAADLRCASRVAAKVGVAPDQLHIVLDRYGMNRGGQGATSHSGEDFADV
jgi:hypothetical protein